MTRSHWVLSQASTGPAGTSPAAPLLTGELAPKQLQLLRELLLNAALFGVLADPAFPATQSTLADLQAAALTLGLTIPETLLATADEVIQ